MVDPDLNLDPNDAAAQWTPGETFVDAARQVRVRVNALDQDGADVTVIFGHPLNVEVEGRGAVLVAPEGSSPTVCPTTCVQAFGVGGTRVQLTAQPTEGSSFVRWAGACSGKEACAVAVWDVTTVKAIFATTPVIATTELATGVMGANYSQPLQLAEASGTTSWTLKSGVLPPGLVFNSGDGTISGVPESAGRYDLVVEALSFGLVAERTLSLVVTRPQLSVSTVLDLLFGSNTNADHRRFLDILGNRNARVDVGDLRAWMLSEESLTAADRAALLRALPPAPGTPR